MKAGKNSNNYHLKVLNNHPETNPTIKIINTIKALDISNFQNKNLISTTVIFCKPKIITKTTRIIPIIVLIFMILIT